MHPIAWTGRIISRALWNGISNYSSNCTESNVSSVQGKKKEIQFLSVVCGFPKDLVNTKVKKGQFGDDAWFSAKFKSADVLGVADGVGGWRNYGIDPGEFSGLLMRTCERLVTSGRFSQSDPADLLANSYYELLEHKQPVSGSSTACVMVLDKETSRVYTANIGDSGFLVVRRGRVVAHSEEQQHYFNTPYQLSLPPPGHAGSVLSDRPEQAQVSEFSVQEGDVVLVATDGVFDNVPRGMLVSLLAEAQGETRLSRLQTIANSIALIARRLAFDQHFVSPFAKSAQQNGINTIGGKPDDITVLLATVAL